MPTPPRIEWDFKHLPSPRDNMEPLGTFVQDGKTLLVAINHTRKELVFIWDDSYGKLVSGGKE